MRRRQGLTTLVFGAFFGLQCAVVTPALAQAPLDLWPPATIAKIEDRSTLNLQVIPQGNYWEVFFDSEIGEAKWADSAPPYAVHTGDTIRIHGYLAMPSSVGPYPAIVIGHGHGGSGDPNLARAVAAFGYVALSIDGPRAGQSTGGPEDTEQAWISVEEAMNVPSPEVSFLYHYIYAGMRAITALDELSRFEGNPFRIDNTRFGVMGASMGGQFTYYVNGVDDRVKGAVAVAVAGDWDNLLRYPGAWLYHGLYHYTRNGLKSGQDFLNTVSNVCEDSTYRTFVSYFDPIQYAPRQHAPLLTIIGTHDQYFTLPAINATFARLASAGTNPRFIKRIMLAANGKHEVVNEDDLLPTLRPVLANVDRWLRYCFSNGAAPPATPTVTMHSDGESLVFGVAAALGSGPLRSVHLHYATQVDTIPDAPCDFASLRLDPVGKGYGGTLPIGGLPPCGPPVRPQNVLYYASVQDDAGYDISSRLYYQGREMGFETDFVPRIEHYPKDHFRVAPPPPPCIP